MAGVPQTLSVKDPSAHASSPPPMRQTPKRAARGAPAPQAGYPTRPSPPAKRPEGFAALLTADPLAAMADLRDNPNDASNASTFVKPFGKLWFDDEDSGRDSDAEDEGTRLPDWSLKEETVKTAFILLQAHAGNSDIVWKLVTVLDIIRSRTVGTDLHTANHTNIFTENMGIVVDVLLHNANAMVQEYGMWMVRRTVGSLRDDEEKKKNLVGAIGGKLAAHAVAVAMADGAGIKPGQEALQLLGALLSVNCEWSTDRWTWLVHIARGLENLLKLRSAKPTSLRAIANAGAEAMFEAFFGATSPTEPTEPAVLPTISQVRTVLDALKAATDAPKAATDTRMIHIGDVLTNACKVFPNEVKAAGGAEIITAFVATCNAIKTEKEGKKGKKGKSTEEILEAIKFGNEGLKWLADSEGKRTGGKAPMTSAAGVPSRPVQPEEEAFVPVPGGAGAGAQSAERKRSNPAPPPPPSRKRVRTKANTDDDSDDTLLLEGDHDGGDELLPAAAGELDGPKLPVDGGDEGGDDNAEMAKARQRLNLARAHVAALEDKKKAEVAFAVAAQQEEEGRKKLAAAQAEVAMGKKAKEEAEKNLQQAAKAVEEADKNLSKVFSS